MTISVTRTGTLPHDGELTDGLEYENWDIDRWENDGGRSLNTRHECGRD